MQIITARTNARIHTHTHTRTHTSSKRGFVSFRGGPCCASHLPARIQYFGLCVVGAVLCVCVCACRRFWCTIARVCSHATHERMPNFLREGLLLLLLLRNQTVRRRARAPAFPLEMALGWSCVRVFFFVGFGLTLAAFAVSPLSVDGDFAQGVLDRVALLVATFGCVCVCVCAVHRGNGIVCPLAAAIVG